MYLRSLIGKDDDAVMFVNKRKKLSDGGFEKVIRVILQ
jgi:hypothetical protein